jgi:hypothetical protein
VNIDAIVLLRDPSKEPDTSFFTSPARYGTVAGQLAGHARWHNICPGTYKAERGVFVNPDAATQRLIDTLNGNTVEGRREIYEVIV